MGVETKDEPAFLVNKDRSDPTSEAYRVLAAVLSGLPEGFSFTTAGDFYPLLLDLMSKSNNPLIKQHFQIHPVYKNSPTLDNLLSPQRAFGAPIGLENTGADYTYRVTRRTQGVVIESVRLGLLSNKDSEALAEFGRSAYTRWY